MQKNSRLKYLLTSWMLMLISFSTVIGQHSAARQWNEALLEAIRNDFARPTVHARNLFHVSAAMYDAWATYDDIAETFLIGKIVDGYQGCALQKVPSPANLEAARSEAVSYAAYRLLRHRFNQSPNSRSTFALFDSLLQAQGYDTTLTTTDYQNGGPAALGNYIAECYIAFGFQDNANEENGYLNRYYQPVNKSIIPIASGNPLIIDPNRWQAIELAVFVDQSGQVLTGAVPTFLSPEWGLVTPFALSQKDLTIHQRGGHEYWAYHDPGPPPYLDVKTGGGTSDLYQWGFSLVSVWSAHLDPGDGVMWDISPGAIGNLLDLPENREAYDLFYDLVEGGDPSQGHVVNPVTGLPYEPQIVPRGDYTRVLAEFWADGPDSETPPGHWFTILNYVNDHPLFEKRFRGEGPVLADLEWDVKAYFTLGGAMHDAAITAWGIKGWYDYVRPISAIRLMADLGQSTDPNLPNYHPAGIPLTPGYVELVQPGDPLAADDRRNIGKIKLYAWRGPGYIPDPEKDAAGVGWILAENWWPYQRPTFVTPPFAGYLSGHSTFSRAAAEIMTLLSGDPYFPGGMGEFIARKNEFLVFEEGPSVDVALQWATYRDASDQTSLSRIWGGIHPPADDIPGRRIGIEIGVDAFTLAEKYFAGDAPESPGIVLTGQLVSKVYPNPIVAGDILKINFDRPISGIQIAIYNALGQNNQYQAAATDRPRSFFEMNTTGLSSGIYFLHISGADWSEVFKVYVH